MSKYKAYSIAAIFRNFSKHGARHNSVTVLAVVPRFFACM